MSGAEYLFRRGLELQQADRDAEAMAVYRRVVTQDPTLASAWFNLAMLLRDVGHDEDALDAFAAYVRTAPPGSDGFVDFANRELLEAGRTPPPAREGVPKVETVQVIVERNGVSTLMLLDNDSGVDFDTLTETLRSFVDAREWADAYLVLRKHPELASSLALNLLRMRADLETREGQIAQENLRVLERSRVAGPDVAFAEAEGMELDDFRLLVRGIDEIQPVLKRLAQAENDAAAAILDSRPEIVTDPATDVLLSYLRKHQSENGQQAIDQMRAMIQARRQLSPTGTNASDYRDRLYSRLTYGGEIDGLIDEGEALRRVAAEGVPDLTLDLALALGHRYEHTDSPHDLQRAIALLREGLVASPSGSRSSVPLLTNLGSLLLRSFERWNQMSNLEEAIDRLTIARRIEGDFSPGSAIIHMSLGSALFRRAASTGSVESREASISMLQRAVDAASLDSPEWVRRQLNLCNPLFLRAERGDQAAVDRILRIVDGLLSRTESSNAITWEILLVSSRARRLAFHWTGEMQHLDNALADYRLLLSRGDLTAPNASLTRSNFGNALRVAYEATGDVDLLDEAIEQFTAALELLRDRSAEAAKQQANLAKVLTRHYEASGDVADLRAAIRLLREVVTAESLAENSLRAESTLNLGAAIHRLGQDLHDVRAVEEGLSLMWEALGRTNSAENPGLVLEASGSIGQQCIADGRYDLAVDALQQGLVAFEEADRMSIGSPARHRLLRRGAGIAQLAAFALVHVGRCEDAVLALERGRARAVADTLKLDLAAIDDLANAGRGDLADKYSSTLRELRVWESRLDGGTPEAAIAQVRALHDSINALTLEVRDVQGFEDFARPVDLETVRRAARDTVLVYGCMTDFGAVLLVVPATGPIEAIHLTDLDSRTVERRATVYLAALSRLRTDPDSPDAELEWTGALEELTGWMGAAFMTRLCAKLLEQGYTRATLMLPGWLNLLPVTAARLTPGSTTATDVLIWSYGPSAVALAIASATASASNTKSALLVGDPEPSDEDPLAAAAAEVDGAEPTFARTTSLMGSRATRDAVLRALPNHDVAHFACHGLGDPIDPLQSFLLLADNQQLTLRDVLLIRVWRMRLCFLSACDTATIGNQAPDEYVSLPTGLVQAGAAAVIAAQWPVWDTAAAVLSIKFYSIWPEMDVDPASAFRRAQLWLRDATRRDVQQFIEQRVPEATGRAILDQLSGLPQQARPFHALEDWAAFAYVGC